MPTASLLSKGTKIVRGDDGTKLYTIKVLNDSQFDKLPFKYAKEALGAADPKTMTAYVRKTHFGEVSKEIDLLTLQHEVQELVSKVSPHEQDGIRYKKGPKLFKDIIAPLGAAILGTVAGGPALGGALAAGTQNLLRGKRGLGRSLLIGGATGGLAGAVAPGIGGLAGKAGSLLGKGVGGIGSQISSLGGGISNFASSIPGLGTIGSGIGGATSLLGKGVSALPGLTSSATGAVKSGIGALSDKVKSLGQAGRSFLSSGADTSLGQAGSSLLSSGAGTGPLSVPGAGGFTLGGTSVGSGFGGSSFGGGAPILPTGISELAKQGVEASTGNFLSNIVNVAKDKLSNPLTLFGLGTLGAGQLRTTPDFPSLGPVTQKFLDPESLSEASKAAQKFNEQRISEDFTVAPETLGLIDVLTKRIKKRGEDDRKTLDRVGLAQSNQFINSGERLELHRKSLEEEELAIEQMEKELINNAQQQHSKERFEAVNAQLAADEQTKRDLLYLDLTELIQKYNVKSADVLEYRKIANQAGVYALTQGLTGGQQSPAVNFNF